MNREPHLEELWCLMHTTAMLAHNLGPCLAWSGGGKRPAFMKQRWLAV
jgi:hypothetical protein